MMHQHRTFGAYLDAVVLKSHFFLDHIGELCIFVLKRENGELIKLMLNHDNCAQLLKLFSSRQAPHVHLLPEKPMGLHERRYTLKNTFVSMGATKSKPPKFAASLKPFLEGLSTLDSLF